MALVTQDNSNGGQFSSLLAPFTGVNNGSARLLKAISAGELATLREGDLVYVMSVRDYWKWLPNSSITNDDIEYCAPTIVGAGLGRFERMMISSPDWPLQGTMCLSSTGHDENSGIDAANAIRTLEEFARRINTQTIWPTDTPNAFHIRLLSDYTTNNLNRLVLKGSGTLTTIYFHASMTDNEGVTPPLYSGTVDALDVLNTATNTPTAITSNGLAVNWAGLIDGRLRMTSGVGIGAVTSPNLQDPVIPKKAQIDEIYIPVASFNVVPFVAPASTLQTINVGDTFVIESLRNITFIEINGSFSRVVLEAISCVSIRCNDTLNLYCFGGRVATSTFNTTTFTTWRSCVYTNLSIADSGSKSLVGGHPIGNLVLINYLGQTSGTYTGVTHQGNRQTTFLGGAGANGTSTWNITRFAQFNAAIQAITIATQGCEIPSTAVMYGTGNSEEHIKILDNCSLGVQGAAALTQPIVTTRAYQVSCGARASRGTIPAFDQATGLYTAPRTLSFANIQATVAAGGFGGSFNDPVTGAEIAQVY